MKPRAKVEQVTAMASLLAAPLRCRIVQMLRAGPMIVGDLVDSLGENQATISKQLAILREAGILACRPDGRCREYALASPDRVGGVIDGLQSLAVDAVAQAARCRARRTVGASSGTRGRTTAASPGRAHTPRSH